MIPILLAVILLQAAEINGDICNNATALQDPVIACATQNYVAFYLAATEEDKCGVVLNNMKPCIKGEILRLYNTECTPKQQHNMLIEVKGEILQYLQFDVTACFLAVSCSDINSIKYYLPIFCEAEYETYIGKNDCSAFDDALDCYVNSTTVSCTVGAIYTTVVKNKESWQFKICPDPEGTTTYANATKIESDSNRGPSTTLSAVGDTSSAVSLLLSYRTVVLTKEDIFRSSQLNLLVLTLFLLVDIFFF